MSTIRTHKRVLVIDHNLAVRFVIARQLRSAGYEVDEASAVDQGVLLFDRNRPQVVMLNPLIAPFSVGRMVVLWCHQHHPSIPVIAMVSQEIAGDWKHPLGSDGWIGIPPGADQMVETIERLAGDPPPPIDGTGPSKSANL